MSLWWSVIVPAIVCLIIVIFFKRKLVWWEVLIPLISPLVFVIIFQSVMVHYLESDTERWGSLITKAEHYDYWESWVNQTCSYTTCTGSGKTEHCTTHHYDCSYCGTHPDEYVLTDNYNNEWNVSQQKYYQLINQWNATERFVELNRYIHHNGYCGKDGDAHEIFWDKKLYSSEPATVEKSYVNKVQSSRSAFNYQFISSKQAKVEGLYDYPPITEKYKECNILGLDSANLSKSNKDSARILFSFLNGAYGSIKKVRVYVLLFYNKPIDISFRQESYWVGGNQNELVVCIGVKPDKKSIDWVRAFSWTDSKRVLVDCRDDISELKALNFDKIYTAITATVERNFHYRNLKVAFSYLNPDLPTWAIIINWLFVMLISIGLSFYVVTNDIDADN